MSKGFKITITVLFGLTFLVSLLDLKDLWFLTAISLLFIFLVWRKPKKKAEPVKVEEAPKRKTTYDFYLAGTTFEQQDGKTGQEILAKVPLTIMRERDEKPYGGYTKKTMEEDCMTEVEIYFGQDFGADVEEYVFEGEPAIRVFLVDDEGKKYQIGNIKRVDIDLFKKVYAERKYMDMNIRGGKIKDIFGDIVETNYSAILNVYI